MQPRVSSGGATVSVETHSSMVKAPLRASAINFFTPLPVIAGVYPCSDSPRGASQCASAASGMVMFAGGATVP